MKSLVLRIAFLFLPTLILGPQSAVMAQNANAIAPLRFGNIYPGIPKNVSRYDAGGAAEFNVSGIAGDEMSITFTLPTYMNYGSHNMQIIFGETDCAADTSASPDQTNPGFDNLDPWHTLTYRLGSSGITLWLGATVVPNLVQEPGDYSATIVLTVIPTGN